MKHTPELIDWNPTDTLKRYDPQNGLSAYFELVKEENRKLNLVSRETIDESLPSLAAESLLPLGSVIRDSFDSYLDIGSGGGFPAFPILLSHDIRRAVLVERTLKKASALGRMSKKLIDDPTRVQILERTFEECSFEHKFDLITLRLVKLTTRLLGKIAALLNDDGYFIYYAIPSFDLSEAPVEFKSYTYTGANQRSEKGFTIITKA